jgi:hypothetical protein
MEDSQSSERGSIPLGTKRLSISGAFCVIIYIMDNNSVFNRLIKDLSQSEKLEMLQKMHHISPINNLPLKIENDDEEYDYENSYSTFSFFEKIIVFFTILFTSKEREKAIENLSMDKLARKLEKETPGLINYQENKFLNKFYIEIEKLQDSLTVFRSILPKIINFHSSDFIVFLVGLHFPEIETELLNSINPNYSAKNFEFESSFQLKRHIEFRIEELLSEIDADKKKIIYKEMKYLHVLNTLASFNFGKIISSFGADGLDNNLSCSFSNIRKSLHQLIDILFSLNISPSIDTLNAIFIFGSEITESYKKENLEGLLKIKMEQVNTSMEVIRRFNKEIPIQSILCLVNRNMNFQPVHIGGAEDWYALFRRFWFKKFDVMMDKYIENEKKVQLVEDAAFFLNSSGKAILTNYRIGMWEQNNHVKYEACVGFISKFISEIFLKELVKPLKLVLIDGQFYKEQNRLDYNKSYSTIIDTNEAIKRIENSLTENGNYYLQYLKLISNDKKDSVYDSLNELYTSIDNEFETIIKSFNNAITILIDVVSGIVQGEMGGVYDTLSNLGYIGKGENKNLISQLNDIRFKMDEAKNISYQLYDLEN